jgi:hypothetical protein
VLHSGLRIRDEYRIWFQLRGDFGWKHENLVCGGNDWLLLRLMLMGLRIGLRTEGADKIHRNNDDHEKLE